MSVKKRRKSDQQKEIESKKIPFVLSGESQYHGKKYAIGITKKLTIRNHYEPR